jgi:hypothetical protein
VNVSNSKINVRKEEVASSYVKGKKSVPVEDVRPDMETSGKRNGAARLQPRKILTISLLKNLNQRCAYFAYGQSPF